jgi:hypothetical protein
VITSPLYIVLLFKPHKMNDFSVKIDEILATSDCHLEIDEMRPLDCRPDHGGCLCYLMIKRK